MMQEFQNISRQEELHRQLIIRSATRSTSEIVSFLGSDTNNMFRGMGAYYSDFDVIYTLAKTNVQFQSYIEHPYSLNLRQIEGDNGMIVAVDRMFGYPDILTMRNVGKRPVIFDFMILPQMPDKPEDIDKFRSIKKFAYTYELYNQGEIIDVGEGDENTSHRRYKFIGSCVGLDTCLSYYIWAYGEFFHDKPEGNSRNSKNKRVTGFHLFPVFQGI